MHSFARHFHNKVPRISAHKTRGLILDQGWRYDLGIWFMDTFLFWGQLRQLRERTVSLALMQPGEAILDVGCGTGKLSLEARRCVGHVGQVAGVSPAPQQIIRTQTLA